MKIHATLLAVGTCLLFSFLPLQQSAGEVLTNVDVVSINVNVSSEHGRDQNYQSLGGSGGFGYNPSSPSLSDSVEYQYDSAFVSTSVSMTWNLDTSSPDGAILSIGGTNWISDTHGYEWQLEAPHGYVHASSYIFFDLTEPTLVRLEYPVIGYPGAARAYIHISGPAGGFYIDAERQGYWLYGTIAPDGNPVVTPSGSLLEFPAGHYEFSTDFRVSGEDAPAQSGSYAVRLSFGTAAVPEPSTYALFALALLLLLYPCLKRSRV